MDHLTEENTIHKELTDSFTFDQELHEPLQFDPGIFVHGDVVYFVRNFATPEDIAERNFFDYLADMYTPPDQLENTLLKRNFLLSHVWSINCLNQYFEKSLKQLDLLHETPDLSK